MKKIMKFMLLLLKEKKSKGLKLGAKILKQSVIDAVINDWELGLYKNFNKLAKAHGIVYNTASKIIKDSGAVKGSRSAEVDAYRKATANFIKNPTDENKEILQSSEDRFQITNLFSLDQIKESTSGLIKDDLIDSMKLQLISSNLLLANALANNNIRQNSKTIFISAGKEGSYPQTVPLDSGDIKNYVDVFDKSLVALGLADRFAPKGDINVQQNNIEGTIKYQATLPTLDEETTEAIDVEPLKEAI